jgi:hypothetical protein
VTSTRVVSSYDWFWTPYLCGPCEAAGQLPSFDLKGKPLPLRFLEAAFWQYPKGFFRGWGYGFRLFNPEALTGTAFKLQRDGGGFFDHWHGLGEPSITARLEPTG